MPFSFTFEVIYSHKLFESKTIPNPSNAWPINIVAYITYIVKDGHTTYHFRNGIAVIFSNISCQLIYLRIWSFNLVCTITDMEVKYKTLTAIPFKIGINNLKKISFFIFWNIQNIKILKGSRKECDNYRGISLLSIAGKIMAHITLNRLNDKITPHVLPETQCGFRNNRSTMDMVFSLRQIQEKCTEQK